MSAYSSPARQRPPVPDFERHPAFKQLDRDLDEGRVPCFPANGDNVRVLTEPSEFYQTLLVSAVVVSFSARRTSSPRADDSRPDDTVQDKIRKAKKRIFIASLYIGKEEQELVRPTLPGRSHTGSDLLTPSRPTHSQVQTLHEALRANPDLQVSVLVDYLRSTRELPGASSASLLASLSAAFPHQVDIRLFHTPALNGWQKRWVPKRFNEGWGLQHMKCYGFDDDVIMSGSVPLGLPLPSLPLQDPQADD